MCSYLYVSWIYDKNLHQTQTKTSHLDSSYEKQYEALTIFSNPKHTSVSGSASPSQWVSACTSKRWDPGSIGYFGTYIEVTNSKPNDVQGGKRLLVKCIMTVMIAL